MIDLVFGPAKFCFADKNKRRIFGWFSGPQNFVLPEKKKSDLILFRISLVFRPEPLAKFIQYSYFKLQQWNSEELKHKKLDH